MHHNEQANNRYHSQDRTVQNTYIVASYTHNDHDQDISELNNYKLVSLIYKNLIQLSDKNALTYITKLETKAIFYIFIMNQLCSLHITPGVIG